MEFLDFGCVWVYFVGAGFVVVEEEEEEKEEKKGEGEI